MCYFYDNFELLLDSGGGGGGASQHRRRHKQSEDLVPISLRYQIYFTLHAVFVVLV